MRVLFCNIAWMKYYNGITDDDKPENGGSWVKENNNATECLNFAPCNDGTYCGYVSTKSNRGKSNQLHIEKLQGINKDQDFAEDVLVIWVAKKNVTAKSTIIGWYKHATVARYYEWIDGDCPFNVIAKVDDCVLLPLDKRNKIVPRAGKDGYSYGMGQSNVWFAQNDDEKAKKYVQNMIEYINSYDGENLALQNERVYN